MCSSAHEYTLSQDLLELAETLGPARPQGLRPEVINNLPLREHNSRLEEDNGSPPGKCVVCMCEYENKEKIRTLPCVHEFHQQCIDQWLQVYTHVYVWAMGYIDCSENYMETVRVVFM